LKTQRLCPSEGVPEPQLVSFQERRKSIGTEEEEEERERDRDL
jgi:hypothetical protein